MDIFDNDSCLNAEKFQVHCDQNLSTYDESPSRLHRINKMLKSIPIRRQFTRRRRKPVARNALQMSLLLLSILAFGTFVTVAVMKNMRRDSRNRDSMYKIIINKTPRMEELPDNSSFTHWASIFLHSFTEFITELSDEL